MCQGKERSERMMNRKSDRIPCSLLRGASIAMTAGESAHRFVARFNLFSYVQRGLYKKARGKRLRGRGEQCDSNLPVPSTFRHILIRCNDSPVTSAPAVSLIDKRAGMKRNARDGLFSVSSGL
jgi:hypothetical protein